MNPTHTHPARISISNTLRAAALLAAALAARTTSAESPQGFTMTMYSNAAGSQQIVSGNYDAAIGYIRQSMSTSASYLSVDATNLCVAQVMAGKLETARSTCNIAVSSARNEQSSAAPWRFRDQSFRTYLAMAYANRAVMHWLAKDVARATADLESAKRSAPSASFVLANVTALTAATERKPPLRLSELP